MSTSRKKVRKPFYVVSENFLLSALDAIQELEHYCKSIYEVRKA